MRKFIVHVTITMVMSATMFSFFSNTAYAQAPQQPVSCDSRFLTIPAWYRGVTDADCNVSVEASGGDLTTFIWKIVFNIVEAMLHVVAYIAAGFVIVGGFKYLTSAGSADANAKGRKTILNAIIGLVISIMSIGIVNLVTANL